MEEIIYAKMYLIRFIYECMCMYVINEFVMYVCVIYGCICMCMWCVCVAGFVYVGRKKKGGQRDQKINCILQIDVKSC